MISNTHRILFSLVLLHGVCLSAGGLRKADTFSNSHDPASSLASTKTDSTTDLPVAANAQIAAAPINSDSTPRDSCISDAKPYTIELRHIEGKGVGYTNGYSTLHGFFMPSYGHFTPIFDLRGHVFDDGRFAANLGVGLRYLSSRVWGINGFFDYRQAKKRNFHQVSLGLESLGRWVDLRVNGYLPYGKTHSRDYHTSFHSFKGNSIVLSRKREFAMRGANAEIGIHMYDKKSLKLYGALGPYYVDGQGKSAWGGEARVAATIYDRFRIQGSTSYDPNFKWIGQGEFSINIPLGPKKKVKNLGNRSCSNAMIMQERAVQRIDRNEIIVVDHKHKHVQAINPATGLPYFVVFVDNTSSSNGTFESPYSTLLTAQNNSKPNDIIYVFPGDGTTKGMNAGIVLQDFQELLGSGVQHSIPTTLGEVTIPAMSTTNPHVTNTNPAGSAVTIANSNVISGFDFLATSTQNVITVPAPGLSGCTITYNNFTGSDDYVAIMLVSSDGGIHGNLAIANNTMINTGSLSSQAPISISPDESSTLTGAIVNNTITNFNSGVTLAVNNTTCLVSNFSISNNMFDLNSLTFNNAINIEAGSEITGLSMNNNIINAPVGAGIVVNVQQTFTFLQAQIIGNQMTTAGGGVGVNADNFGTTCCYFISGNNFQGPGTGVTGGTNAGTLLMNLTNNISPSGYFITTEGDSGIVFLAPTTSNIGTFTLSGNIGTMPNSVTCQNCPQQ